MGMNENINKLIRLAITDRDLRTKLFNDPALTFIEFGIDAIDQPPDNTPIRRDPSIMQGGFRP